MISFYLFTKSDLLCIRVVHSRNRVCDIFTSPSNHMFGTVPKMKSKSYQDFRF